jgi:hypothetical protein
MARETAAQHLNRLIALIGEALAVADGGDQPLLAAHLDNALRAAIARRAIPDGVG